MGEILSHPLGSSLAAMIHPGCLSFFFSAIGSLSVSLFVLVIVHLQWLSHIYMAANGSGHCLLLVESGWLTRSVQYLLYGQLPLAVETFCKATVPYVDN